MRKALFLDRDGVVNAADYTVWRDGQGTVFTPSDYEVWANNFGRMAAPFSRAIPEPATGILLLLAGVGCRGPRSY